jgi:hypothetical protein
MINSLWAPLTCNHSSQCYNDTQQSFLWAYIQLSKVIILHSFLSIKVITDPNWIEISHIALSCPIHLHLAVRVHWAVPQISRCKRYSIYTGAVYRLCFGELFHALKPNAQIINEKSGLTHHHYRWSSFKKITRIKFQTTCVEQSTVV